MVDVSPSGNKVTVTVTATSGNSSVAITNNQAYYWSEESRKYAEESKDYALQSSTSAEQAQEQLASVITAKTEAIDVINTHSAEKITQIETSGNEAITSITTAKTDAVNELDVYVAQHHDELKGEKGDKGDKGEQGIQGIQGIQGLKGDKGEQGAQGIQGVQGEKGEKGDKGDKGDAGSVDNIQFADIKGNATDNLSLNTALTNGLSTKQNTISDLSTIRSQANNSVQYGTVANKNLYLATHPELGGNSVKIPFIHNDIAYLLEKGGSCKYYVDGVLTSSTQLKTLFNGKPNYFTSDPQKYNEWTFEITLDTAYYYTNVIYVDFGSTSWSCEYVKIERRLNNSDEWVLVNEYTNNKSSAVSIVSNGDSIGIKALRFTFREPSTGTRYSSGFRIAQIGLLNYQSSGAQSTLLGLGGGTLYGNVNFASGELTGYQKTIDDLATIRSGASKGATAIQQAQLEAYHDNTKQDILTAGSAIGIDNNEVAVKLFDRSNFTVVGTPTITDDGVVSGFSANNFVKVTNQHWDGKRWKFMGCFTTASDVTTGQSVGGLTGGGDYNYVLIQSARLRTFLRTTNSIYNFNNTPIGSFVIQPNTKYYYSYEFTGSKYILGISDDNANWTYGEITDSAELTNITQTEFRFGLIPSYATTLDTYKFLGQIDLSQFSITVDGVEIFSGNQTIYQALETLQTRYVVAKSDKSLLPTWWVAYNDGWCEQGGKSSGSAGRAVSLVKEFKDTNYNITGSITDSTSTTGDNSIVFGSFSTKAFKIYSISTTRWKTSGYLAEGEY